MDYKKTSILLKKIKSLHNTLMDNADHPSTIEKQLMQSYLRDFYDSFVSGEGATDIFAEDTQKSAQETQTVQVSPVVEPLTKLEPPQETAPTIIPLQNTVSEPIQPIETPDAEIVELEPTKVIEQTTLETSTPIESPIDQDKQADAKTDIEMVHDGKEIVKQIVNDPVDQDLLALFTESPITDLSDKLALLPIRDLTKALSINERFFTIQELFGGDSDLFQATLMKLNNYTDFEQASQELMSSVATEFDWSSAEKQQKATNFIKLVRRRYQ